MMVRLIIIQLIIVLFSFSSLNAQDIEQVIVIPQPKVIELSGGSVFMKLKNFFYNFELSDSTSIDSALVNQTFLDLSSDWYLSPIKSVRPFFRFIEQSDLAPEAYTIDLQPTGVEIHASDFNGFFYGIQTLKQLTDRNNGLAPLRFPRGFISDSPDFKYRGLHLDVSRHFFSVDEVKKYIDLMARYKYNTLHWHLTDDQGWRIEIEKYPLLTEVGAFRSRTLKDHYSVEPHEYIEEEYGGYYTHEDIKDVVSYSLSRGIEVIPEIELPGHARAALAAYPEFSCTGIELPVAQKWGVFDDIYCSSDNSIAFLEDVLDEVLKFFPSTYIHIGGDEAPTKRWETCNTCQENIKKYELEDELALQTHFVNQIIDYLAKNGKTAIGWDEILNKDLNKKAIIMSWRGESGGIKAARTGHEVIMTPWHTNYFDHYQSHSSEEPVAIGSMTTLREIYDYEVIPEELETEYHQLILGGQANLWTEYITTFDKLTYMAYPRACALAENLWNKEQTIEWSDFMRKMTFQRHWFAMHEIEISTHFANIITEISEDNPGKLRLRKDMACCGQIHYSLDGSDPTPSSQIYKNEMLDTSSVINARIFWKGADISGLYKFYDKNN